MKLITKTLTHNFEHALMFFASSYHKDYLAFVESAFIDRSVTYHGKNRNTMYIVEVVDEAVYDRFLQCWENVMRSEESRWQSFGITLSLSVQDVVDQK